VGIRCRIEKQVKAWPVYRQMAGTGRLGRGEAAKSRASGRLASPVQAADAVVKSVCPSCAVGCGQNV
jgi:formate dehydrogenase major subunit